jgi:uncharacterized protein
VSGMPEPIRRTAPPLTGRAIAAQHWSDLAFVHWRADPARVAPLLPPGVVPDEHDGSTWVGLIPFRLHRASLFGGPPVPVIGEFIEVNVRLYAVDARGRRGVVFRSLEASRLLAVLAARAAFGLPYRWAATSLRREGDTLIFDSRRHVGGTRSHLVVRSGEPVGADTLADFLTARWGMFTRLRGRTVFVPNEHEPWPLHTAELVELSDELVGAAGLPGLVDRPPDSVLYSPGVATRFGRPLR